MVGMNISFTSLWDNLTRFSVGNNVPVPEWFLENDRPKLLGERQYFIWRWGRGPNMETHMLIHGGVALTTIHANCRTIINPKIVAIDCACEMICDRCFFFWTTILFTTKAIINPWLFNFACIMNYTSNNILILG